MLHAVKHAVLLPMLALICTLGMALPAEAASWYVNDTSTTGDSFTFAVGSNGNAGSQAAPFRSVQFAMDSASSGDTIFVDKGLYAETVAIETNVIFLIGADSGTSGTVLDFGDSSTGTNAEGIRVTSKNFITIQNLRIQNSRIGIHFSNVEYGTINNVAVNFCALAGITLETGTETTTVSNCNSSNNLYGVEIKVNSSQNTITRNTFKSNNQDGLGVFSTSESNAITFNTADSNSVIGFNIADGNDQETMTNNVSKNNGSHGYLVESDENYVLDNIADGNFGSGFKFSLSEDNDIERNLSRNNYIAGFRLQGLLNTNFKQNVADSNFNTGILFEGSTSGDTYVRNTIFVNSLTESGVFNTTSNAQVLTRTWWGTTDSVIIQNSIKGSGASLITYYPFRLGEVDTTAVADTVAPNAPDSVSAVVISESSIVVNWTASSGSEESEVAPNLSGYRIYRSQVSETSFWVLMGQVSSNILNYDDSGLTPTETYCYRVTAFDTKTPLVNESFYSDSIVCGRTFASIAGANAWYVNDTSTTGDIFTTAVGDSMNHGQHSSSPKRHIGTVLRFVNQGDTIFIDAGTYHETIVVDTSMLFLIGKDSSLTGTIIDIGDSAASIGTGVYAVNETSIIIRNMRFQNLGAGIHFVNTDSSRIEDVTTSYNGVVGVKLAQGSDSILLDRFVSEKNGGRGIFNTRNSDSNIIRHGVISSNSLAAIGVDSSTGLSISNVTMTNNQYGIWLSNSDSNALEKLTIDSNTLDGVRISELSDKNYVTLIESKNNGRHGFFLGEGSDSNLLIHDTASRNGASGFRISSDQNDIKQIRSTKNRGAGISLISESNELVENNDIRFSVAELNDSSGIFLDSAINNFFAQNTFDSNGFYQGYLSFGSTSDTFYKNNFIPSTVNPDSRLFIDLPVVSAFTRNWWGTIDSGLIDSGITGLGESFVSYIPFRIGLVDTSPGADTVAPNAPTAITAEPVDSSTIRIRWNASSGSEEGESTPGVARYKIYRSLTTDTTNWELAGNVTTLFLEDGGQPPNSKFNYRVTALDAYSPFPNESYFSDSIISDTLTSSSIDPSGPNAWYVNDLLLTNDSFTFFPGAPSNDGLTPRSPGNNLQTLWPMLTSGDTVYIDAGNHGLSDSLTFYADTIWVFGVDSAFTIVAGVVTKPGFVLTNRRAITIKDLSFVQSTQSLDVDSTSNLTMSGIHLKTTTTALKFDNVSDISIDDLEITFATTGFDIDISSNVTMNRIRVNSPQTIGFIDGCTTIHFGRLSANTPTTRGLVVQSSSDFRASNSSITGGPTAFELTLVDTSVIETTTITGGTLYGIQVNRSNQNEFRSNTITGKSRGVYLLNESIGNKITNSLFQNDTTNIHSDSAIFLDILQNQFEGGRIFNDTASDTFRMSFNNFYNQTESSIVNNYTQVISEFSKNFWNTQDSVVIASYFSLPGADSDDYIPFRLQAIDTGVGADSVAPAAPSSVTVTQLSATEVQLDWSESVTGEDPEAFTTVNGYNIYQALAPDTRLWKLVATVPKTPQLYKDTGLIPMIDYYYRLTAFDDVSLFPNESYFSDSIVKIKPLIDTSVPNVWYVNNDTTANDSFTFAEGYDTNNGLQPAFPMRTISHVMQLVTPGDTIFVDAGVYQESVTITISGIAIFGRDSTANGTIIDPGDSAVTGETGITAASGVGMFSINNLVVRNAYYGISLTGADSSRFQDVILEKNGGAGLILTNGSDSNEFVRLISRLNMDSGITIRNSSGNRITNTILSNNLGAGFDLVNTTGNRLFQNTAESNQLYQLSMTGSVSNDSIQKNNFVTSTTNTDSAFINSTNSNVNVTRNWWTTVDTQEIRNRIVGSGSLNVTYIPFRLGSVDTGLGADTVAPNAPDTVGHELLDSTTVRVLWSQASGSEEAEASASITGYKIYRSKTADTTFWLQFGETNASTFTFNDTASVLGETIYYRVTTIDNQTPFVNESFYSDSIHCVRGGFETQKPETFVLLFPPNNFETNTLSVSFLWSASVDSSPVTYRLVVDTLSSTASVVDTTLADTGATFTLTPNETYIWRVIAIDTFGNTITIGDSTFTIDTIVEIGLITPDSDGTQIGSSPVFVWQETGVETSTIQISTVSGFSNIVDSKVTVETSYQPTNLDSGLYFWRVIGDDAAGNQFTSSIRIVRIDTGVADTTPPIGFTQTAPANGTESSVTTIRFAWNFSADTGSGIVVYILQVDTGGSFDTFVLNQSLSPDTNEFFATLAGSDSYFWRVLAKDYSGNTVATTTRSFIVDTIVPKRVSLVSPKNRAETTATSIKFTWIAGVDTGSGILGYRLQVATDTQFTSLKFDAFNYGTASETTPNYLFTTFDTFYWRLAAQDEAGNQDTTSFDSFVRSSPSETVQPVSVSGLVATANTDGTITICWLRSPSADMDGGQYNVYWDSGTGEIAETSSALAVVVHNTADTGYCYTTAVLQSGTLYSFTVRAQDKNGNENTDSTKVSAWALIGTNPTPHAKITAPVTGEKLQYGSVIIVAEIDPLTSENAVNNVLFQYRKDTTNVNAAWETMTTVNNINSNPLLRLPDGRFIITWDVSGKSGGTALDTGVYQLRAVATTETGVTDTMPPVISISLVDTQATRLDTQAADGTTRTQVEIYQGRANTVISADDSTVVDLTIPKDALTSDSTDVIIVISPTAKRAPSAKLAVGSSVDISLADGQTTFGGKSIMVKLSYLDRDKNQLIDGTSFNVNKLEMWVFSDALGWEKMTNLIVDTSANTVQATTTHFSTFVLVVGANVSGNLSGFSVYPNPFMPNDGNANTGQRFDGSASTGITFINLPLRVKIAIYTITGRKVAEFGTQNSTGSIQWDVRNDDFRDVATGVYIYVVEDLETGEKVTGKLAVFR